jgi:uncharacterized protein (UPF0335 family)
VSSAERYKKMTETEHERSISLSAELLDSVARFIAYHKQIIERLEDENKHLNQRIGELLSEKIRPHGL